MRVADTRDEAGEAGRAEEQVSLSSDQPCSVARTVAVRNLVRRDDGGDREQIGRGDVEAFHGELVQVEGLHQANLR
jgi:hypothetical protein